MLAHADAARPAESWQRWLAPALVAVVTVAYLPSLGGGFLNYDDPWLIRDNPVFARPLLAALRTIWFDLGISARAQLGGEYLPVRDTSHLLEVTLVGGAHASLMRVTQLVVYLATVLLFRVALLRSLPDRWVAELAAWLFALHPVHAESVAWLAGRKDVLALGFVAAALALHAGTGRHRWWGVPALLAGACLSKSMSVMAIALLPAVDLMKWRRPDWRVYGLSVVVCAPLAVIALQVGRAIGVPVPFWGGSRWHAAATMGPVWLRYLGLAAWPVGSSLVYDVPVRAAWDAPAWLGLATIVAWGAAGVVLAWRRRPLLGSTWLWFVAPLLPVSQMLISVENRMADRYLFLSVMGPALLAATALLRGGRRGLAVGALVALVLGAGTAARAHVFADSIRVWQDATAKTAVNGIAPYQLGMALMDAGRDAEAERAFREAIARARPPRAVGRKAVTALSRLLVRRGQLVEAEQLLQAAARDFAPDPIVLGNLADVLARLGRLDEARARFLDVMARFPDYAWAKARYRERFGPPPQAQPVDGTP